MAGAILNGLLASKLVRPSELYLFDTQKDKMQKLLSLGANECGSSKEVVKSAEYIILAVKPQVIFSVMDDISGYFTKDHCIVSIAAGITISSLENKLPVKCAIARVMPNTPLMLGQGASAICFNEVVTEPQKKNVESFFSVSGKAVYCEEEQIDAVVAVSGSAPAYFFRIVRDMTEKGQDLGLESDKAAELIIQTMIGSATMLRDSGMTPQELINMVTSPKGTTLAALEKMDELKFDEVLCQALQACYDRAKELGKES